MDGAKRKRERMIERERKRERENESKRGRYMLCQPELRGDDRRVCVCVFLLARTWLVRKTSVSEYQSLWAGRCLSAAGYRSVLSEAPREHLCLLICNLSFCGMIL